MKKFFLNKLTALLVLTLIFTACNDDDPGVVNEEEVITTVNVTLTPVGGGATVNLQWRDLDGENGPNAATITGGTLVAGTVYNGTIELLNETETPVEDITEEIEEEDDEHQFFFAFTNGIAQASYSDMDGNNNPIGLAFQLTNVTAGVGDFTITLLHEPDKTAPGVSGGNPTNAGGETDVEVTFPITVN